MRASLVAALIAVGAFVWSDAGARGQQPAQPPVPKAPTDKTAYWSAEDIQGRWRENEALKRANSRLFNGPTDVTTNWTVNIRIVPGDDPPLTHEGTADLWIVTAGTAVARTDGQVVGTGGKQSIQNGMQRSVKAGDILYVPPGVPHHFTDIKGFRAYLIRFDTVGLTQTIPAAQKQPDPDLPTNKTAFWPAADIEGRWKENEARARANSRFYNGPTNISGNVRIVLPDDPPLTHEATADLWIVTAGTAVARTDGQIAGDGKTSSIRNATVRNVKAGDILYVPPGVPHHFTEVKGFRAFLIRADTLGVVKAPAAGQTGNAARN
jgi:mannose-6-phosphate isomerase-like protein (cupin superfamily)